MRTPLLLMSILKKKITFMIWAFKATYPNKSNILSVFFEIVFDGGLLFLS
jgi:hypothetical protein